MAIIRIPQTSSRDPQTSSRVIWPNSRRGMVHITAALPISGVPSNFIPIELKFPRADFDRIVQATDYTSKLTADEQAIIASHLDRALRPLVGLSPQEVLNDWARSISETLHYFGLHCSGKGSHAIMSTRWSWLPHSDESRHRQARQTLKSEFARVPFRIVLQRSELRALGTRCGTPEGKRELIFAIRWYLLPHILVDWGLNGLPRGRQLIRRQFLKQTSTIALCMARELMLRVEKDHDLQEDLDQIGRSEGYVQTLKLETKNGASKAALQRQMALWLTERTLRPAWKRYKVCSPLELDPNAAFKQHCPSQLRNQLKDMLGQLSTEQRHNFVGTWFQRLLGPVGKTANDFDLL